MTPESETVEAPLEAMGASRRGVLTALKRGGPAPVAELARALGVTTAAVRQQLSRLEEDGLVVRTDARPAGRGRPARRFALTGAAEALFPKRYGDLTTELLSYLGGPDSLEVRRLFDRRGRRRRAEADGRLEGRDLADRVAGLTAILDEDGYLADVEELPDGGWRITEHNCAILTVARGYPRACASELDFIRTALPGAEVRRVAHLLDGQHVCAYEVRPAAG